MKLHPLSSLISVFISLTFKICLQLPACVDRFKAEVDIDGRLLTKKYLDELQLNELLKVSWYVWMVRVEVSWYFCMVRVEVSWYVWLRRVAVTLISLAGKGSSELVSLVEKGSSGLVSPAEKGSNELVSPAEKGSSELVSLGEKSEKANHNSMDRNMDELLKLEELLKGKLTWKTAL